jgi:transcriptional/translational regulatory protein YebC/TACO1
MITVFAPNTEYAKARAALVGALGEIDFEVDEIQYLPQSQTRLSEEDSEIFEKFLQMLDFLDDVQNIYHNVET